MLGQVYAIIIRFSHFCFVGEPAGTFFFIDFHPFHRHDGKHPVVIDPRTGLVGLLKTTDLVSRIYILPSISHLSGLWHPEIHSPRHGNRRISITCRERKFRLASDQRIHVIHQVLFVGRIHRKEAAAKRNR